MKLTRIWLVRFARITMKCVNIFYSEDDTVQNPDPDRGVGGMDELPITRQERNKGQCVRGEN